MLDFPITNRKEKQTTKKATIKQQDDEDHYHLELVNRKQQVIKYNDLINMINKDEDKAIEKWMYKSINAH